MRAGKAYITSLGTTAMLVASSVLLLVVVGALVAFDGWPSSNAYSTPETVAIGKGDPERVVAKRRLARELRAAEARRDRARDRRASGSRKRSGSSDGAGREADDRVISDLPAPDSRPGVGGVGGREASSADPVAGDIPSRPGGGTGGGAVDQVGGTVGTVSPQAGTTIGQTGDAVSGAIEQVIAPVAPVLVAP